MRAISAIVEYLKISALASIGQNLSNILFVLGNGRTWYFAFEIYWPLVIVLRDTGKITLPGTVYLLLVSLNSMTTTGQNWYIASPLVFEYLW